MLASPATGAGSGRDFLHELARSTDRRLFTGLVFQLLLAALFGWLQGSLVERSGWFTDGSGEPLTGTLAVGFAWVYPLVWGFVIFHLMAWWRDCLQLFYIPLLRRSFLLYSVLEHQPHEAALLPLCLTPPVLTLRNRNPIRTFAARIRSLVWVLPLVSRQQNYRDYPAGWGPRANAAFFTGMALVLAVVAMPGRWAECVLALPAFALLAGWTAFQQARLQAAAWCLAAVFLPPKGD